MNGFKITDVPEIKNSDTEKFKMEKPESSMSVKEARVFWDNRFKGGEETEHKEPVEKENQEQKVESRQEYYTTIEERMERLPKDGEWTGELGNSKFITHNEEVNKVLEKYELDGIEYNEGIPDFSKCAVVSLEIDNMTSNLATNYRQFCKKCAEKWSEEGKISVSRDVAEYKTENKLDFHECSDMKTCQLVPSEIHEHFTHTGGRMECKKREESGIGGKADE